MGIMGFVFTFAIPAGILIVFAACSISEAEKERNSAKDAKCKGHTVRG